MSENGTEPVVVEESKPAAFRPLWVWPAVGFVVLLWVIRTVTGQIKETTLPVMMVQFFGPTVIAGMILIWWAFFSRATVKEKIVGFFGFVVILVASIALAHPSIQVFGMLYSAIPWAITGFTVALVVLRNKLSFQRTTLALLTAACCFGYWDLVRMDAMLGDFETTINWRWQPTAEEQFLKTADSRKKVGSEGATFDSESLTNPEWPSFRGPNRDGIQPGIALASDWKTKPPRELWRIKVGPAWSSFSVAGNRLFTQEQRGEREVVACYDAESGAEVWIHKNDTRFWEAAGGAGPRATPTIAHNSLFTLGATGRLDRLDPATGKPVWQRNLNDDAEREPPTWGYASSPLVVDNKVIVYAGGKDNKGIFAYDIETGEPVWKAPSGDHSYSSPHLATILNQNCIVMVTNKGLALHEVKSGAVLCNHEWPYEGYRVLQPMILEDSSLLLATRTGSGTQRVAFKEADEQIVSEERWTSKRISPDFSDFVSHNGYLYGFDNGVFSCSDIQTGKRIWKKGRYGHGQVLLLPDGDQLLITSEKGELVLVQASPKKLIEQSRLQVLKGRTWNHPVLIGNRLYVRNDKEAACYEMATAKQAVIEQAAN